MECDPLTTVYSVIFGIIGIVIGTTLAVGLIGLVLLLFRELRNT